MTDETRDPVVEEVRSRGRALTERLGNNVRALMQLVADRARQRPEGVVDAIVVVAESQAAEPKRPGATS